MNDTSTAVAVSTSGQNQLSWQSAFWAIMTIALATMADAPGMVWGYPKELTFYLKISPLTCLIDVLGTVLLAVELATRAKSKLSERQAISLVARVKMGLGGGGSSSSNGLADIPRSPIRFILFIFGALPQAIKLYACKGTFIAQTVSTCYLASFLLDELMFFLSRLTESEVNTNTFIDRSSQTNRFLKKVRALCWNVRHEFVLLSMVLPCSNNLWRGKRTESWALYWIQILYIPTVSLFLSIVILKARLEEWREWQKKQRLHHRAQQRRSWRYNRRWRQVALSPNTQDSSTSEDLETRSIDEFISSGWNSEVNAAVTSAVISSATCAVLIALGVLVKPKWWGETALQEIASYLVGFLLILVFGCDFCLRRQLQVHVVQQQRSYVEQELRFIWEIVLWSLMFCALAYGGSLLFSLTNVVGMFVAAAFFQFLGGILVSAMRVRTLRQADASKHSFPVITYCILTVSIFVVYYCWVYNPRGTHKPSWTDWLG